MGRLIVTLIVIVVVIGIGLAMMGALRFENTPEKTILTLDKREVQEKTQRAMEDTGEMLQRTGGELRGQNQASQPPATTPANAPVDRRHGDQGVRQADQRNRPQEKKKDDSFDPAKYWPYVY
jgi:hypothetical protein